MPDSKPTTSIDGKCTACNHDTSFHIRGKCLHLAGGVDSPSLFCGCSVYFPAPPPLPASKTYQIEYADGYYIAKDGVGVINFEASEDFAFAEFVCDALNAAESRGD